MMAIQITIPALNEVVRAHLRVFDRAMAIFREIFRS